MALLSPQQIFSLQDAIDLGIDEDYDTDNSVFAYKTIKEFYSEAKDGSELWIMLVSTALSLTDMADKTNTNYAIKLLNAARGKIRVLGISRSPVGGYTPVVTNGLDVDVETALVKAQELALYQRDKFAPVTIILPALYYQGEPAPLPDLKTFSSNCVSVLLGDTVAGSNAAVGLLLGRFSAVPVQRNPGRVANGPTQTLFVYLGSEALESTGGDNSALHAKGYITFRQYVGKSGYYFTDDPTATAATDDYSSFARVRVINKAVEIAYATYLNFILDEVVVDAEGKLPLSFVKFMETLIETNININMTNEGNISSVKAHVDPDQNIISTRRLCIDLRIVPVGYNKEILVKIGYQNPSTN